MKKKSLMLLLASVIMCSMAACGNKDEGSGEVSQNEVVSGNQQTVISWDDMTGAEDTEDEEVFVEEEAPDGMYKSELTGEFISIDLKDQRPIAVMVDNEKKSGGNINSPNHYGTSQADIVYEMMNSTANGRITRLMCIFKDYNSVEKIGNVRSIRPTNLEIIPEYDAIAVHDGGPYYIDAYLNGPRISHLSGGFFRDRNMPLEDYYREFVTTGEINDRCAKANISQTYRDDYYPGQHFKFANHDQKVDLSKESNAKAVNNLDLAQDHNKTKLTYIPENNTYRYSEYGMDYVDELTGEPMEFTNVILQESTFGEYDNHGYMVFHVGVGEGRRGYYLTNGYCVPITWQRDLYGLYITRYYLEDGTEITLNIGKTYIGIIADDRWDKMVLE